MKASELVKVIEQMVSDNAEEDPEIYINGGEDTYYGIEGIEEDARGDGLAITLGDVQEED